MTVSCAEIKEEIKGLIYKACLYQDDLDWDAWLGLCDEDFQYSICAYSPEIQADMILPEWRPRVYAKPDRDVAQTQL